MKKVINNKRYDTDTATKMGTWDNGYGILDFSYCEETLYKKRTGEFFLYAWGGANSYYAQSCGDNCYGSGEYITPLTEEKARKWAEKRLEYETYVSIFGEPEE